MKNKLKLTAMLILMLVVASLGGVSRQAHAEDKVYSGKPYDIVIKYEFDNDENDIKYFFQYYINKFDLVADKIPGTGTPEGDLEKVKDFLEKKTEEVGLASVDAGIIGCPDYTSFGANRGTAFRGTFGGTQCSMIPKGLTMDGARVPDSFDSKQVYVIKPSFEPDLLRKIRPDDYANIERDPIEPKEKFEDTEIVEKTFVSPSAQENKTTSEPKMSSVTAPDTGYAQAVDYLGFGTVLTGVMLAFATWRIYKK